MTTIDPDAAAPRADTSVTAPTPVGETEAADRLGSTLQAVGQWFTTTDHKRIGMHFIATGLVVALLTAVFGVLLGIERISTDALVFQLPVVNEFFEGFRLGLVLAVLAPLGIGLAIAVVPLQIGARSLAFARLAHGAYYTWLAGVVLAVYALLNDGSTAGSDRQMVELYLLAHGLIVIGLVVAAVCVATTILTSRAPGMTLMRVPMFTWSALITAIGVVLVLPVAIGTLIYLFVDIRYGGGVFTEGAAAWLGWLFTQPLTVLLALPAVGVFAELLPVTFRTRLPLRPAMMAALALVGVAAFAGIAQQAVVRTAVGDAESLVPFLVFNALPLLGLLLVFAVALLAAKPATNDDGSRRLPRFSGAFLLSFFGFGMVLVGTIANAGHAVEDLELIGTVFEEGALVYVGYGGLLGILGGVTWWLPKLTGRRLSDVVVSGLALAGVVATILASLPYLIAGFAGQPARTPVFSTSGPMELWNLLVLVGHALMLMVVLAVLVLLARSYLAGGDEEVGDDPFDAQTIEWTTTSPAPPNNYPEVPTVTSAEPLTDLKTHSTAGSSS